MKDLWSHVCKQSMSSRHFALGVYSTYRSAKQILCIPFRIVFMCFEHGLLWQSCIFTPCQVLTPYFQLFLANIEPGLLFQQDGLLIQDSNLNIAIYQCIKISYTCMVFLFFFLYTPFILTAVILKFKGPDKGYYTYSNFEMSFRMLKNKNHEIYCKHLAQNHKWMFWLYMYTTCNTISSASYL